MLARLWFTSGGRISRRLYWQAFLLPGLVIWWLGASADVLTDAPRLPGPFPLALWGGLTLLLTCVPLTMGAIKRLHDHGSSGWWTATIWAALWLGPVSFTPLEGSELVSTARALAYLYVLCAMWVLAVMRGDVGLNKYGPPPEVRTP